MARVNILLCTIQEFGIDSQMKDSKTIKKRFFLPLKNYAIEFFAPRCCTQQSLHKFLKCLSWWKINNLYTAFVCEDTISLAKSLSHKSLKARRRTLSILSSFYNLLQVSATNGSPRLLSGVLFLLSTVVLIKKSDTFPNANINWNLL